MAFSAAVKACLTKYATFSGRSSRPEYWWFALFYLLAVVAMSLLDAMIFGIDPVTDEPNGMLATVMQLALFLPLVAAGWRRLHDTGRPGWYILLPTLVSLASFLFLVLGVMSFGVAENTVADPDALEGPAGMLGATGFIVVILVQLILAVVMIWWLTRPSEPQDNAYGPVPA